MSLSQVVIPLITHLVPILFFFYTGIEIWIRNPGKVEYRLVGAIAICFMLLFVEEYVRHQLPIVYSPRLASLWFSCVGITIPGLGFHLFAKIGQLDKHMPRFLYPYLFYVPLIVIPLNYLMDGKLMSALTFEQIGIWKQPEYNMPYYIAMTVSIINNFLYLIPLFMGKHKAISRESQQIYRYLIFGVVLSACWFIVFGYINFSGALPPYPYLYGGIIWCFFLRHTMRKHDFLDFMDKRYEKLFNLNPAAILLVDQYGTIKEANPSALKLLDQLQLGGHEFRTFLHDDLKLRLQDRETIHNLELSVSNGDRYLDVLIDGDHVWVEDQLHMILIIRDVTKQKENQREISYLAYHDVLTRLPNRRFFCEKLEEAILRANLYGSKLAVILIDLDYFKEINDRYGHQAGDQLLQHVAGVLRDTVQNCGIAARLGGDEFVIFVDSIQLVDKVEDLVCQLHSAFACGEWIYEGVPIYVSMSIGTSLYPEDGLEVDTLLNSADKSMYEVKRRSRMV